MKYSELIEVNQRYQASVNLEYDLNDKNKIRSYIPTDQSVKILGILLRSYYYDSEPQNRATVLIGPYGRGKSHLLLVLSALTSLDVRATSLEEKHEANEIQLELCEKIARVDRAIGSLATEIVNSNIRTLPVIINSNSTDINQSFLLAINDALINAGLHDLIPETYFDSAVSIIDKWQKEFPDAYKDLSLELKKVKTTVEDLRIGLEQYSQKSYDLFRQCYPRIAAGAEFNPLINTDVVKLYLSVIDALNRQTSYRGITIIFDEFSKFLEANLDKSRMLNFKIIQDMAEAATRSGRSQLHLTCITHKDILDYSSSDSFKTVEGRFRKIRFVSSSEQSYELIANAIIKKPGFIPFSEKYKLEFDKLQSDSALVNVFSDLSEDTYKQKLVYGCFPLTPLSAYALLHVSELVGQNERTLFTFIAQKDPYALRSFLETDCHGFSAVTIDYIYDYFEDLFKREVFNSSIHSIWAKTDSALRQAQNSSQRKILKAIAVIKIIADERFRTIPAHIKASLMMSDEEFDSAANALMKIHVLAQRDSSEFVLLTANGVDVQRTVDNFVNTHLARIDECAALDKACDLGYVLPRAYNDEFGMMRCFKNVYMTAAVFVQYQSADQILAEFSYDGLIIHIVCIQTGQEESVTAKVETFVGTPQIVICITRLPFSYESLLKHYEAAGALRGMNSGNGDPHFLEELDVYEEDLKKQIRNAVNIMYSPASEYSRFMNCDGELPVARQAELNREISRICSICYNRTPVVNNEMVNKRKLNTQNTKARDRVSDWLLQHSDDPVIPCMEGYGPEVSVFKSSIKYKGLDVSPETNDPGMNEVLKKIDEFIVGSKKEPCGFESLYETLTSAPYGMRKGIIPIYIAYVLRQYKGDAILYFKDGEIELSAAALSHLNDNPGQYHLLLDVDTVERDHYLNALQAMFRQYADAGKQSVNRIYTIVKSMQNWMRSLPEFTKKYKIYLENGRGLKISNSINVVRNELMKFEINARELLFDTLIENLSEDGSLDQCVDELANVKEILDHHMETYRTELTRKLTDLFKPGYQGSLSHAVMSWYEKLPVDTRQHMFNANTNELLALAGSITSYNDIELLDQFVDIFVAIAIEDWNDELAKSFFRSIQTAVERINTYVDIPQSLEAEGKLTISMNGSVFEKTFGSNSITALGNTAYNNLLSVFEEYNDSLEPDEQLAILAKLINKIIH